jgi:general stress protein 26
MKAWFPDGLDDPDLALLRVHVEAAEYWDSPSSTMVHIVGFVRPSRPAALSAR